MRIYGSKAGGGMKTVFIILALLAVTYMYIREVVYRLSQRKNRE